jgi:hypothetical protein
MPCGCCPSMPTWPTWPSATRPSGPPGGDDDRAGLRLADRLARAGLEVVEFRGRYLIGSPSPGVRPPGWAAREAMLAAGVA